MKLGFGKKQPVSAPNREGAPVATVESREERVKRLAQETLTQLKNASVIPSDPAKKTGNELKDRYLELKRIGNLPFYYTAEFMVEHASTNPALASFRNFVLDHWEAHEAHKLEKQAHGGHNLLKPAHIFETLGKKATEEVVVTEAIRKGHDLVAGHFVNMLSMLASKYPKLFEHVSPHLNKIGGLAKNATEAGVLLFAGEQAGHLLQSMTAVVMARKDPQEMLGRLEHFVDAHLSLYEELSAKRSQSSRRSRRV